MARNSLSKGSAGGGPGSKAMAKVTVYHPGQRAQAKNPGGVSQYGNAQGNHSSDPGRTSSYRGDPQDLPVKPISVELGNSLAPQTVCAPGGSRTVMKTGTQNQWGTPAPGNPPPQRKSFD